MTGARRTQLFLKVDPNMPDHPKIEALSDRAFRELFRLWAYCWKQNTDGEIKPARWKKLPPKARHELITSGLIEEVSGVLIVHDYLDHQLSSEERREASGARSHGGSRGMHNRWHKARGVVNPGCGFCDDEAPSVIHNGHNPSYNPGNNSAITEEEKEKELRDLSSRPPVTTAHAKPPRGAPGPDSSPAFRLVRRVCPALTSATKTALTIEVGTLMAEVDEPTLVAALERWNTRTGISPKLLPALVDDIRKEARGATTRPSTTDIHPTDAAIARLVGGPTLRALPGGETA